MKIYALYKGDKLLADGTLLQIAHKMGVKLKTIKFYKTPTYLKRRSKSKNFRELVEL